MNARVAKKVLAEGGCRGGYRVSQVLRAERVLRGRPQWKPRRRHYLPRFRVKRIQGTLSAYNMPISKVIEDNSLKNMVPIRGYVFDFKYEPAHAPGEE